MTLLVPTLTDGTPGLSSQAVAHGDLSALAALFHAAAGIATTAAGGKPATNLQALLPALLDTSSAGQNKAGALSVGGLLTALLSLAVTGGVTITPDAVNRTLLSGQLLAGHTAPPVNILASDGSTALFRVNNQGGITNPGGSLSSNGALTIIGGVTAPSGFTVGTSSLTSGGGLVLSSGPAEFRTLSVAQIQALAAPTTAKVYRASNARNLVLNTTTGAMSLELAGQGSGAWVIYNLTAAKWVLLSTMVEMQS